MPKPQSPAFSATLAALIAMLDNAVKDYEWNYNEVNKLDHLTQDYLHSLELDFLDYKDRAKIATKLSRTRRERRDHKDLAMALEPLVEFLTSDRGQRMLNDLREALGKTRKVEAYLETRRYYPRVLGKDA